MNNLRESQRKNKVCMCVCVREREREIHSKHLLC
jgi:hypothetical protein